MTRAPPPADHLVRPSTTARAAAPQLRGRPAHRCVRHPGPQRVLLRGALPASRVPHQRPVVAPDGSRRSSTARWEPNFPSCAWVSAISPAMPRSTKSDQGGAPAGRTMAGSCCRTTVSIRWTGLWQHRGGTAAPALLSLHDRRARCGRPRDRDGARSASSRDQLDDGAADHPRTRGRPAAGRSDPVRCRHRSSSGSAGSRCRARRSASSRRPRKAGTPVMARPIINVWISSVPS